MWLLTTLQGEYNFRAAVRKILRSLHKQKLRYAHLNLARLRVQYRCFLSSKVGTG